MRNKKGQVMSNLGALGIGVATLTIVLVVAFLIMATANGNMTVDNPTYGCAESGYSFNVTGNTCCSGAGTCTTGYSAAYNSTQTLRTATATIPGWVSIVIITAIGSILIGMVMMFRR